MNNNSEVFQTSQGLKYSMNKDLWQLINTYTQTHPAKGMYSALEMLEWNIVAVETLPYCNYFVWFLITSITYPKGSEFFISVISVIAFVLGTMIVRAYPTVSLPLQHPIICIYYILSRFFGNLIVVLIVSIFILHKWYIVFLYTLIEILLRLVYSVTYGSYKKMEKVHDKIAHDIIAMVRDGIL